MYIFYSFFYRDKQNFNSDHRYIIINKLFIDYISDMYSSTSNKMFIYLFYFNKIKLIYNTKSNIWRIWGAGS